MANKESKINPIHGKLRMGISLTLSLIVMLLIAVPILGADNTSVDTAEVPPVSVPVILDGVKYQPDEFNRINSELHSKGVYLGSVVDPEDGSLVAFTSSKEMDNWLKKRGFPTTQDILESAEKYGPATIIKLESSEKAGATKEWPTMVSNWENINYGGSGFGLSYGIINNLHSSGWGDRISSIDVGSQRAEIVYENINQSGSWHLFVMAGHSNLHSIGWGDRISSLAVGIAS